MGNRTIRRRNRGYNLFFVKPGRNADVHKTAKKLIEIERIKEVIITEGAYGFVVKADVHYEESALDLKKEIAKVVGGSSRGAVCYCQYSK
jgi:hypothetical protein